MNADQRARLGAEVKARRNARGWSQDKLAVEAGVAPNTVLAVEAGRNTQAAKLRRVLDALDVSEPTEDILAMDGVPEDVRIFLTVAKQRLMVLPEDLRARVMSGIYPRLLTDLPKQADTRGNRVIT